MDSLNQVSCYFKNFCGSYIHNVVEFMVIYQSYLKHY